MKVCATCVHFKREVWPLECHRYPPIPVVLPGGTVVSRWPTVDYEDGCGEWEEAQKEGATDAAKEAC